ncbi:MAG: tRNA (adenosine(37)-N6)-threonylcarbamoyltransferase complex ATPase subunit type 1 TsaE [bacterium]|nr:tRNA (adenosine(37)-N6)-threonylcarbamoyltransferase complex ATPase subunit type 1 TsaE [bacterium]
MGHTYTARTPADLQAIARDILATKPKLLALVGPLGAGKTTFTQALGQELGVQERVTSPSYVLQHIHRLPAGQAYDTLVHVDCYRIKADHEVPALDLTYWCEQPKTLVVIEWADRINNFLTDLQPVWVTFRVQADESRRLVLS